MKGRELRLIRKSKERQKEGAGGSWQSEMGES